MTKIGLKMGNYSSKKKKKTWGWQYFQNTSWLKLELD